MDIKIWYSIETPPEARRKTGWINAHILHCIVLSDKYQSIWEEKFLSAVSQYMVRISIYL
jgi:hypothetical protein